jgi:hypothetical protein
VRRQLRAEIDVAVAAAFGLDQADLRWILRGCDHPASSLRCRDFMRSLDAKGFWRIDRRLPPAARLPQLVLGLAAETLPAGRAQPTNSRRR